MNEDTLKPGLDRAQRWFLMVGVVALAACAYGAYSNWTGFLRAYLVAYMLWFLIGIGCLAILMLHHMVGGKWGYVIRRTLEAGTRTIPLLALFFIPLAIGHSDQQLYPAVSGTSFKALYLSPSFYFARVIIYFAAFLFFAYSLNKVSSLQDQGTAHGLLKRFSNLSAPGLLIYCAAISWASFDWVMALEPNFFSTIFGMIFIIMSALAAMSFTIIVSMILSKHKPLLGVITSYNFNDLGNILLTFVMLWAYLSFSQFLIIWAGNMQDENFWYAVRGTGGWRWVALFIILFHFAVPFILLLNRPVKRHMKALAFVGGSLVVMTWIDLYWFIMPAFYPLGPHIDWIDIVAPFAVGGLWLAFFVRQLKAKPRLPLHDPRFEGVVQHG
ncbi:MAG: hypothetical protein EPN47_09320 [Acidobacteria bacterium]|nr:MAG: hypothetical protein EPN47_09320 [Acidobacteriota bacterium]